MPVRAGTRPGRGGEPRRVPASRGDDLPGPGWRGPRPAGEGRWTAASRRGAAISVPGRPGRTCQERRRPSPAGGRATGQVAGEQRQASADRGDGPPGPGAGLLARGEHRPGRDRLRNRGDALPEPGQPGSAGEGGTSRAATGFGGSRGNPPRPGTRTGGACRGGQVTGRTAVRGRGAAVARTGPTARGSEASRREQRSAPSGRAGVAACAGDEWSLVPRGRAG